MAKERRDLSGSLVLKGKCGNICVELDFLRGEKTDKKPNYVLSSFWTALKPEEQFTGDIVTAQDRGR